MMRRFCHGSVVIVLLAAVLNAGRLKTDQRVLNICMDGKHHKHEPVATMLFGVCQPWESLSCCSNETAFHTQNTFTPLYNLNLSHCGEWSDNCLRRFYLTSCFYECSPNVGPWLRPDRSSIRNERLYDVPICKSDCDAWWSDCKHQLTCVDKFSKGGFDWINGTNHCPAGNKCQNFEKWFHNATYFCENLYPHDFKVVENKSAACMKLDIQGSENPNAKVAEEYAKSKGLYKPDGNHNKSTPTTLAIPNNGSVTTPPPVGHSDGVVVAFTISTVVLITIVFGVCIYKCRNDIETSRRDGTRFFPRCCTWFKRARTSVNSVVHHQTESEDRQFLAEDDEDEDDFNPHGALEIEL